MSEFRKCQNCPKDAVVKLNNNPLCLECYERAMKGIGRITRYLKDTVKP